MSAHNEEILKRKKKVGIIVSAAVIVTVLIWVLAFTISSYAKPEKMRECREKLQILSPILKIAAGETEAYPLDPIKAYEQLTGTCGSGYIYLKGVKTNAEGDTILLFDKETNHAAGRNVLLVNGVVIWMKEKQFRYTIKEALSKGYGDRYSEESRTRLEEIAITADTASGEVWLDIGKTAVLTLLTAAAVLWIMSILGIVRLAKFVNKR